MRIYGCGGLGLNLVSKLEEVKSSQSVSLDTISLSYIDTSESNLRHNKIDEKDLYIIEQEDDSKKGSGKHRSQNYVAIKEQIKKILLTHEPEDFNVVIHSLSGGSGSVIGPLLVSELINSGKAAVVIAVGSSDSLIEINNSLNTLKSYISISEKMDHPIAMIYYENGDNPREVVDSKVQATASLLGIYLNKNNHELDFSDVSNFLNYSKVTDYRSTLVMAKFYTAKIEPPHNCHVLAALTLAKPGQSTNGGYPVDYQGTGFVNEETLSPEMVAKLPNHFCLIDGLVSDVVNGLQSKLKEAEKVKQAAISKRVTVTNALDDGMVL